MLVSIKAITLTNKIAKQLPIVYTFTQVEYNLLKTGYTFTGILMLCGEYYVLASHKRDEINKLIPTNAFTSTGWLDLIGTNNPHNLHRIVLV